MDNSILNTPQPQASSTVNRRPYESLPPVSSNVLMQSQVSSPAFLANAIDEMRLLTDQLGTLHVKSGNTLKQHQSSSHSHQLCKAASLAGLNDERRESAAAESEANSSLGILKLDDDQDILASSYLDNHELLSNFHKEFSFLSQAGKENNEPDLSSGKISVSRLSINEVGENVCLPVSDIDSKVHSSKSDSPHRNSLSMQADLRLRLQKALAQRTIDRSMDSIRMSQMSEFDVDSVSMKSENEPVIENESEDVEASISNTEQIKSPASNATFGAANFLSFSGSPAVLDSSENFQSAGNKQNFLTLFSDLAMDRMKQDENSWRQHFEDLPVGQSTERVVKSNVSGLEHLTQNLDMSAMSGIISGEVTMSSSIMEDVGKRRLSAGEYFKLHSEQIGGADRPNFGNLIKSPPKRRPHPPLISLNTSQASYVDDIPTRDSGLNKTLSTSLADSMDFLSSVTSDAFGLPPKESPASRSMDLMPPPPPRPRPSSALTCSSDLRDSMSSRLSMSLSLPRDSDFRMKEDLNSSSLSLDSGEKFVSISQMVKIMQDLPSGPKSARQLVDDFMQKCRIPKTSPLRQSTGNEANQSKRSSSGLNETSNSKTTSKSSSRDIAVINESHSSPSRNQRVKDWVSSINNSGTESLIANDDAYNPKATIKDETYSMYNVKKNQRGQSIATVNTQTSNPNPGGEQKFMSSKEKIDNSLRIPPLHSERDDESVASFMPPPSGFGIPTLAQLRNFSTPKAQTKQISRDSNCGRNSNNLDRSKSCSSLKDTAHETGSDSGDRCSRMSQSSQGSDQKSVRFQRSHEKCFDVKHTSQSSSQTSNPYNRRSVTQSSDTESGAQISDWKHQTSTDRPPSNCGSTRSGVSCSKTSSKQTDVGSGPLQIDSTHTQLSWASVLPGSSVTHTFALRNRSTARVRLLVNSPNSAFKLVGERGEVSSELILTLHSEETRRIHVMFSPISIGPVVGKLVICRVATSESSAASSEDRRLIALYGYGGLAELAVVGASKDRWSQLFLNMCMVDTDTCLEVSDIDASNDAPQVVAMFSVRNTGRVPAYISLQIAGELPFEDCGVYLTPKEMSLLPGEAGRIVVRFDPHRDVLQWLNKNADDMQLLGNIWLSWSELATWQRIRRIYVKYYKSDKSGPLSSWGSLYTGDVGVGHELKDNKSSEAALAQAVRRLKVAVLIERERLNLFDMDATLIFDQLVANETAMFNSPQFNDKTMDSPDFADSPILAGMPSDVHPMRNGDSPLSSVSAVSKRSSSKQSNLNIGNDLVVVTSVSGEESQTYTLEFPPTMVGHKSKIKITFQNPSPERNLVSISDMSSPFSVSTPKFHVPSHSYVTMSVLFRPIESGTHHRSLSIFIDGCNIRTYLLRGEGVHN
ncbi:Centrosomal protein of 192 kDa [Frankliniella fusca]|uniref:Centrosomal protein of 192 kDa n=1 Tax=Frankliniella fusca TaxID=407009 RepID=A0AAE1L5Q8_9NEOP|nr:Centrosomal protein of 192 kDa [Frankliniella fusca]